MKSCSIEGCVRKYHAKGFCKLHYSRAHDHPKSPPRDKPQKPFKPNDNITNGDHAEIILKNCKRVEVGKALVDFNDLELVLKWVWHLNGQGYAAHKSGKEKLLMHRLIMNCPSGMEVDHINHNTLDNRKCNLRICTHGQNLLNQKVRDDNKVGIKGVSLHKSWGWEAWIQVDKKKKHLGWYTTIEEATEVRKRAEQKYYGEYAYTG